MAFIFLSTDPFKNVPAKQTNEKDVLDEIVGTSVRRPYRGIQIKKNTYSTISVRRPDGSAIPLTSSSDLNGHTRSGRVGSVAEYSDYILQSVSDQRAEKQQIIETFGDPYVYFFGERPRIVTFSGLLINTEDFNWRSQFWSNYENYFRGTRLVQLNARCYIAYDTIVVEGYPINASAQDIADQPYSVPFNISVLVTNYYDYSSIGQTRFPGYGQQVDLDALNKELENRRSQYVSSGADVRLLNLQAGLTSGRGVLDTLRSGIRAVNQGISWVGGIADRVNQTVGGRTVRVPIGIAGSIAQAGGAAFAAGSVFGGNTLGQQFDAATGNFEGINGSVKVRAPDNALYAPSWISEITKQPRGYIHENIDEYPQRRQAEYLVELLKPADDLDAQKRQLERYKRVEQQSKLLAHHNMLAEGGGLLGDLAEAVDFAKSQFGMVMTAASFISDPLGSFKASVGIGLGTTSQARTARARLKDELEKRGITASATRSFTSSSRQFVGQEAKTTIAELQALKAAEPEAEVSIGEVYDSNTYYSQAQDKEARVGTDADYEAVYGDNDYTPLIERAEAVDPETASTGEAVGFSETEVAATLDEVYGNTDDATESDVDPSSLEEVYGTGLTPKSVRSPEEIAAALAEFQAQYPPNEEDTTGIVGVGDVDAVIDPIA